MRRPQRRTSRRSAGPGSTDHRAGLKTAALSRTKSSGETSKNISTRIVTRRVSAQHLKSDNPDLTPAAAAATDTKRITRSRSTAADLVPPLEKHGRKRQALDDSNSGSSDAAAGSSGKRLTCSICLEDVAVSKMHRMGSCRHMFCVRCLSSYYKSVLQSKQLPASCPAPGCKAAVSVRDATVIFAAAPKTANKFIQANRDATSISKGTAIYCPNSRCSRVVNIRKLSAAAARKMSVAERHRAQQAMHKSTCKHCNKNCCTSCRGPWHAGMTCAEYQALPAADKGEADMALWELSDDKHWKRCPSCRSMVERIEGCNYMMCRCNKPFCYRCGAKIEICYSMGCIGGRAWT